MNEKRSEDKRSESVEPKGPNSGGGADEGREPGEHGARGLLGGVAHFLQHLGRDVLSVTLGRTRESPEAEEPSAAPESGERQVERTATERRLSMLEHVAEKLRGAADSYIAAKLDEIEARVDAKLDSIEDRIDRKIRDLQDQLRELRDVELRHRLRLLKITLIFTVLVALISLVYKWVVHWVAQ